MDWNKISKQQPYEAPSGYFEKLPGIIQSSVHKENKSNRWTLFLKWSLLPALAGCLFVVFNWVLISNKAPEELLAEVPTDELVYYLEVSDTSTDELLNELSPDVFAEDFLYEENMFNDKLNDETLDQLIDMYEIDDIVL